MSEENEENVEAQEDENDGIWSLFHNKLKDVDITQIEQTIGKALSELVGVKYRCRINKITYGEQSYKGGEFTVVLSEKQKSSF